MYEALLREAYDQNVEIYEKPMKQTIRGLYSDNIIWINKCIPSAAERTCILAEELGHYHTTVGNILDQTKVENRKQELRARYWAHEKLVPLHKIVQAQKEGIRNRFELADYFGITEEFLEEALKRYKEKYGLFTIVNGIALYFDPLGTLEMIV
ncbi:ImmA/IrrE family metallo-endopeptidase [Bacillus sp. Bva_UNVM-123]|uniref:ImmA/IrrE family metallo-endopeptidase n=1 Tax=Bacillus sp. Bva_UNVM-123 TaxID=2829798 RepID=UPI00391F057D